MADRTPTAITLSDGSLHLTPQQALNRVAQMATMTETERRKVAADLHAVADVLDPPAAAPRGAEAGADTARLDWLEQRGAVHGPWLTYECVHAFEWQKNGTERENVLATLVGREVVRNSLGANISLRDAIDAARRFPDTTEGAL